MMKTFLQKTSDLFQAPPFRQALKPLMCFSRPLQRRTWADCGG
jgi:hypothetical protein